MAKRLRCPNCGSLRISGKVSVPSKAERQMKAKIVNCLLCFNYNSKTLKKVFRLVKKDFQKKGQ